MDRRNFLKNMLLTGAGLTAGSAVLEKRKEAIDLDYPDIEDVPELLQGYAKQFSSWKELIQDQQNTLINFMRSPVIKRNLENDLKETFPDKDHGEIELLASELIRDKQSQVRNVNLAYKDLLKLMNLGYYNLGEANPSQDTIVLDTTLLDRHDYRKIKHHKFQKSKASITSPFHEFYHASQVYKLTLFTTYKKIIDVLISSEVITKEEGEYWLSVSCILENGRLEKLESTIPDTGHAHLAPHEIIPYIAEIRFTMHIASQNNNKNANIPAFNMYTDTFSDSHYAFVAMNLQKMNDGGTSSNDPSEEILKLQVLFTQLHKDDFLKLINECV